jgi:uncharacterized protein YcaQ
MPTPIQVDRAAARRFLATRHFLSPPRSLPAEPASVMQVVERLGSLQFDPIDVTGRNHDLVLAARIEGYRRSWTDDLLYQNRQLFEAYNKGLSLLPVSELPWHRWTWDRHRIRHDAAAFRDHDALVEELLDRIRRNGPLSATDLEPREAIDWYWRPTNPVRAILEALAEAGILGLARREGNRRVYDLMDRLYPPAVLAAQPPPHEQRLHRLLSRYRGHGLLGRSGSAELWFGLAHRQTDGEEAPAPSRGELLDELVERGELLPVSIDGVRGERFVLPAERRMLDDAVRAVADGDSGPDGVAFLAALDPLVWDRQFRRTLYDFDYIWEVYVPAPKRRWGYYVLPVLWRDRLVGRIEPRVDRQAGVLRVVGLWWEAGFDPAAESGFAESFADALDAHRAFTGMRRVVLPRTARARHVAGAVRDRQGLARARS